MINKPRLTKKALIRKINNQARNKRLKIEITILIIGVMALLHQTGILVMTAGHSHLL